MPVYNLDTSVWIDFLEKRGNNGEYARRLIDKIIEENSMIIYSSIHLKELKDLGYIHDEINRLLRVAKPNNLRFVHTSPEHITEAKRLGKHHCVPNADALHAILAGDNLALMIATDHHFERLRSLVETKTPLQVLDP